MTKQITPQWLGTVLGNHWLRKANGLTLPPLPRAHFPTRTPGLLFVVIITGDRVTALHWERGHRWTATLNDDGRTWRPWRRSGRP